MNKKLVLSLLVILMVICTGAFAQGKVLPGYDGVFQKGYLLQPQDLFGKSSEDLGLMRNEIYAKYGRAFKTKKYRDYFSSKKWYKVNPKFNDGFLTDTDNKNIEMVLSFEKPRLTEAAVREKVLDNIEYKGKDGEVVFSDESYLMYHAGSADRGFYGESSEAMMEWEVAGNWIRAEQQGPYHIVVIYLLLDHDTQKIIKEYDNIEEY